MDTPPPVPGNVSFTHEDTAVLSVAAIEAPQVVTSAAFDDRLAATYARTGIRSGLLESVAGIRERRWWGPDVTFTDAAAMAGAKALAEAGIDPARVGLLVDTAVSRAALEPSAAVAVHDALGLSSSCLNFDLSNACLGFMNAMHLAGTMLDAGHIEYALVVDGEGARHTQEATLTRLAQPTTTAADVFAEFATLTLGSGAAAMVLGRASAHPEGHRVVAGVTRAATEHHDLCVGTIERMRTDTARLLVAGLDLAEAAWVEARQHHDWDDMARYVVHQVSQVHTSALCERLGLDPDRVPTTFPHFGNIGPASVPFTLAHIADELEPGDRVLCMGIGSGLNAALTELAW